MVVGRNVPTTIQTYAKICYNFQRFFFIKSAVDQKNLKLGVVIAWTISHSHSDVPGGIQFFGPALFAKGLFIKHR